MNAELITTQTQAMQSAEPMTEALSMRESMEVQSMVIVAKKFPRDEKQALDKILNACTRKGLAESALYTYSRGGTEITGPSIRLAESISQCWTNISSSWRVLSVSTDSMGVKTSKVEAFCWDMENNSRKALTFDVRHWRDTKQGGYALKDDRDVYELIANMAQRRLRACILAMIPGDIIEEAVSQCELTMKQSADVSPEGIKKLVDTFEKIGVTKELIEARIQRRIDSITSAQVVSLRKIYTSIKDGMSKPEEWFKAKAEEKSPLAKASKKTEPAKPEEPPVDDDPLPFTA